MSETSDLVGDLTRAFQDQRRKEYQCAAEDESRPNYERIDFRALAEATDEELDELERLGGSRDPSDWSSYLVLWEQVVGRVSSVAAGEARLFRDLLWHELQRIEEVWEAEGRRHSTRQSDPVFWNVAQATVNRMHSVQRGAQPIEDEKEVARIVDEVTHPDTTHPEIMQLIESLSQRR